MKIDKNRWYKVILEGRQHIVRVDDRIMKYCVIAYYDGKLWFTGSCASCKRFVLEHIDSGFIHYDVQGRA